MNKFLKNEFTLRIISILLAIVAWFIVLDNSNPMVVKTITIPIKVLNETALPQKGLMITKDYQRTIDVTFRARKDVSERVNVNDFSATVDLGKINSTKDSRLLINGPKYLGKEDIIITSSQNNYIDLSIEKIQSNYFPVQVDIQGSLPADYKILKTAIKPERVYIEDIQSIVDIIGKVVVSVDVTNLQWDSSITRECKVMSKTGKEIPLSKLPQVEIKVDVAKKVTIKPDITGTPAQGYDYEVKSISPDNVYITGSQNNLSKINELLTQTINLDGLTQTTNFTKPIKLPTGIKLVNSPSTATVNVNIFNSGRKEVTIKPSDIKIINGSDLLNYNIAGSDMKLVILGQNSIIQNIDAAKLNPTIDVTNLAEGNSKVKLTVDLPAQSSLDKDYYVNVNISKK